MAKKPVKRKSAKLSFKKSKPKLFSKAGLKSRKGLLFILAFVLVGGFLVYRSFAAPVVEHYEGNLGGSNPTSRSFTFNMNNGSWLYAVSSRYQDLSIRMVDANGMQLVAQGPTQGAYGRWQPASKKYTWKAGYYGIAPASYTITITDTNPTNVSNFVLDIGYDRKDPAPPPTSVYWREEFATQESLNNMIGVGGDSIGPNNNPESDSNGHRAVTFSADHDVNCGAPTTYRTITENNAWPNHRYWCPNAGGHFMTSMNTTSYVALAFTPRGENDRAKIFPDDANKICFDVNITGQGNRRWWDVLVLSESKYLSHMYPTNVSGQPGGAITTQPGLIYFDPDHAVTGLNVGLDADFHFVDHEGSASVAQNGSWRFQNHQPVNRNISDKASRYRTCLTDNGNNSVTQTQARPDGTVRTVVMPNTSFPRGNKVFVMIDKTYNADKAENPAATSNAYTWHWDNIEISRR